MDGSPLGAVDELASGHVGVAGVARLQREHRRREVLLAEPAALVHPRHLRPGVVLERLVASERWGRTEVGLKGIF